MSVTETTWAALDGAVIGGIMATVGSVVASVVGARSIARSQAAENQAALLFEARDVCRQIEILRARWKQERGDEPFDFRKPQDSQRAHEQWIEESSFLYRLGSVGCRLTIPKYFDIAVALRASNGTEGDGYYLNLADQIDKLLNPKVQERIEYYRRVV